MADSDSAWIPFADENDTERDSDTYYSANGCDFPKHQTQFVVNNEASAREERHYK